MLKKTVSSKKMTRHPVAMRMAFGWLIVLAFFIPLSLQAQLGLTDAMANESAAESRSHQQQITDYTFKKGDFTMLLLPSLNLEYNDNINLSQSDPENDLIIMPTVGLTTSYPLTDRNLLQFNTTVGYSKYVLHDSLSAWYLQSGSGLSFDLFIKDILINVHDQFSYIQDSALNSAVANTGTYGSFQNSAGLYINWNLKKIGFTVGYDHQNTISTTGQFSDTDNSSELAYARIGYMSSSKLMTGVESTASFTGYGQNVLNANNSYSVGVFVDWKPSSVFHIEPRAGYVIYTFQNTSPFLNTSDANSWYADLNVSHKITDWMEYSMDLGHMENLGVQSDLNETWYVRPSIIWNFIKGYTFHTSLFYEHGNQGGGSSVLSTNQIAALFGMPASKVPSNNLVSESYDWYGGEISLNHAITKRISMSINCRITKRSSSAAGRGYLQDIFGIQLTYRPI